jgi:chemotaxis protein CheX
MKAEYINPFVNATVEAFDKMLGCQVHRGALTLKTSRGTNFDISGVIGLSGNAIGTVVLSFSKELALKAAGALLMTEMTEISDDVVDAVGELTNMVAGAAKSKLEELNLSISLPNVITGAGHEIRFPSEVTPICIPFESEWGPLTVEVGLTAVAETVGA